MSHSPISEETKETKVHPNPPTADLEVGDHGIITHAAPLARQLKGRHMQMIALGMSLALKQIPADLIF